VYGGSIEGVRVMRSEAGNAVTSAPGRLATATHCPYCSLQCGIELQHAASGWTLAGRDFPTNRGGLCQKGWTAAELLTSPERLQTPLVRDRRDAPLRPATWDEALDRITDAIRRLQRAHGHDAIGVFGSGSLTNEKAYALGKFARVALRTSQIDYNGRFCMSSAAAGALGAFGLDRGLPFPLIDVASAGAILLVGSNLAETMPPVMQHFEEQRRHGGVVIVADPRLTPTAAAATLHLQLTPGTDTALLNGLLHITIQAGRVAESFIAQRTTGFDAVRRVTASYWPSRVERITGVPETQLREAARLMWSAPTAMVLTARGTEQQSHGVDNVRACINLALALGLPGTPGCGYGCLTGQGNGQGGREHGQKTDQLPGYRRLDDEAHRAHIAGIWGVAPHDLPQPGRSAYELLSTMGTDEGVRALLVFGSNPVISSPRAGHIEQRFAALDFLVVADFFLSETAALADVVLPSAQWAEEDGTMTNLEGRVVLRQRAAAPPEGVRTDLDIIAALGARLGRAEQFPSNPETTFEELRRASAGGAADYAGITYERLRQSDGLFWPCPAVDHPGTPHLFMTRFATDDGRARFQAVQHRPPAEEPTDDYPFYLTTGRLLAHYQSGTQTRRVPALLKAAPHPFVQVHPSVADTFGIAHGDCVQVTTRRGTAQLVAHLSGAVRMDTLFVPFHYPGTGRVNLLTNPALDPVSRMPEFKVCAARLEKDTRC
jgi:assimilatory nitrate reductase catalytic subunit